LTLAERDATAIQRETPAAIRLAISGNSTVPTAMPMTPIGNWLSRSA